MTDDNKEIAVETTGSLARKAGISPATVRLYVKNGLLDCSRTEDGRRLFKPSAVARARAIFERRMNGKGYVPRE
jgi:DNA-binding transcriptional MerR regulator